MKTEMNNSTRIARYALLAVVMLAGSGCVGTVVGAATDVVIETAKVPFKVGAAAVDVAVPDKKKESDED